MGCIAETGYRWMPPSPFGLLQRDSVSAIPPRDDPDPSSSRSQTGCPSAFTPGTGACCVSANGSAALNPGSLVGALAVPAESEELGMYLAHRSLVQNYWPHLLSLRPGGHHAVNRLIDDGIMEELPPPAVASSLPN